MCKGNLVAIRAVMGHQKPSRQPFFELAARIRERRVGRLDDKRMPELQQYGVHGGVLLYGSTEIVDLHAPPLSAKLYVGVIRGAVRPHQDSKPGHALSSDEPDLDTSVLTPIGYDGRKAAFEKIYIFNSPVANLQPVPDRQISSLQVWCQPAKILSREARQKTIRGCSKLRSFRHGSLPNQGKSTTAVSQPDAPNHRHTVRNPTPRTPGMTAVCRVCAVASRRASYGRCPGASKVVVNTLKVVVKESERTTAAFSSVSYGYSGFR